MNIKLKDVKTAETSLMKLFANTKLPQKYLYRLKFLVRALRDVEDERSALIKKHNPENIDYSIKPDSTDEFKAKARALIDAINKDFADFLDEEIEIKFMPIPVKDIQDVAGLDALDYLNLENFLEGEPEDGPAPEKEQK